MALVDDAHGARTLTNTNSVASVAGKVGNCAEFVDASANMLGVGSDAGIEFLGVDFYCCAWIKFLDIGTEYEVPLCKRPGTYYGEWQLHVTPAGALQFETYGSGGIVDITSSVTPSTGVWYFIEWGVKDGGTTGFICLDRGTEDTGTVAIDTAGSSLFIGYDGGVEYFDGLVDQFAIYSAVPGSTYRDELYNSGSGKSYASLSGTTDLVSFWELDGGGGGPTTLTPDVAVCSTTAVAPTVTVGSVSVAPGVATCTSTVVAPSITIGATTLSPGVAECICAALLPSLTIGGVTVSVGVATCATTANAPSLSGDTSLSVDPCTCSTSAIAPTVTPGAVSASPGTCSVTATVVAPTVVCGAVSVSPGVASASCSAVDPALSLVIVVTPGFASASCSANAPSITCGAVSVQPGTATCVAIVIGPPLEGEEPTGYASALSGMSGIQVDGD